MAEWMAQTETEFCKKLIFVLEVPVPRRISKGFTLVELLLVVAIIGIISAMAVPYLNGQRKRARVVGDAQANAKVVQMAMEQRYADMSFYGRPGDYIYKSDGTRPSGDGMDILPGFEPKGNSKMDFKITIGDTCLTYTLVVTDPVGSGDRHVLTADQTGGIIVDRGY
jgi:prepilin-type N-terminal cleavage/methylation domain-containing protein